MVVAGIQERDAPPGEIPQVVEHLFRHEWGKMVSRLTSIFGIDRLNLAEDLVQEAEIISLLEQHNTVSNRSPSFPEEIKDDSLRMMFVCCHPIVPREAQVA